MAYSLAQVVKAAAALSGNASHLDLSQVECTEAAKLVAKCLVENKGHIVLGRVARSLECYSELMVMANELARICDGTAGVLPSLANEVGAQLVGFTPYRAAFNGYHTKGLNTRQMLENQRKGYVLLNTELEHDAFNSQLALTALNKAETVVVMSAYVNEEMLNYADVILPVTPFTETAGSYVNLEGRYQKFNGVTKPLGEAKPAWKVLRVLANNLNLDGFEHTSIEDVRAEISELSETSSYLTNALKVATLTIAKPEINGLIRVGLPGIYSADSISRRSPSLQATPWAQAPLVQISGPLAAKLGFNAGDSLEVKQAHANKKFAAATAKLPESVVVLAKTTATVGFAGSFDTIEVNA
jgi:NADH-quinone oxidoreductase subunit G